MTKNILVIFSLIVFSGLLTVRASEGQFKVTGTITDGDGSLIDGANVVVTCGSTTHTITSRDGFYRSGFSNSQCPAGSTITVDVDKDGLTGFTTANATSENIVADVVITSVTEVPEFTTTTATLAMLAAGGLYMAHKKGLLFTNK